MKYIIIFAAFACNLATAGLPSWYTGPAAPRPAPIPMYVAPAPATRHVAPPPPPGSCYSIADPDLRTHCRALSTGDASTCYAINNPDQRALCRARAR